MDDGAETATAMVGNTVVEPTILTATTEVTTPTTTITTTAAISPITIDDTQNPLTVPTSPTSAPTTPSAATKTLSMPILTAASAFKLPLSLELQQQLATAAIAAGYLPPTYLMDLYNSNIIANTAEPYPNAPAELVACPSCQRTFNPTTLLKHVGICQKMATKKRNVFDSSRQRREGTELASYPLPKNFGLPPSKQERGQSPKPQAQHLASPILTRRKSGDEFTRTTARASLRKMSTASSHSGVQSPTATMANSTIATNASSTALMTTSGGGSGNGAGVGVGNFTRDRMRSSERSLAKRIQPPPSEQCPHCDRCFGIKAYDRHVEWCKEKALQATIKQGTKIEQKIAKERLEARTKYRAPCLKTKRSINRDKYAALTGDENDLVDHPKAGYNNNTNNSGASTNNNNNSNSIMSLSMTSSMTSDSGLPTDKYDPFLSAKRQLEELCSSSPPTNVSPVRSKTPQTPTAPTVTALPAKMTTSLTLSSSSPNTSPLTTNSQNRSTPLAVKGSNFRRTSSLRGPRRSPMLPSRPLFAQNHRPTIQRGLSDEGPISTNFLKPEEYDEMPVRSVCSNDYAITNSPRVVRRDNSLSNRKQTLKLNVHGGTIAPSPTTPTPTLTPTPTPTPNITYTNSKDELLEPVARNLSKTDSLAVFLKYENELAKLQAFNADTAAATINKPVEHSPPNTPLAAQQNLAHSPVTTKELKDKSNTLSKQNSAKSIKTESIESPNTQQQPQVQSQAPIAAASEQREKLPHQLPIVDKVTCAPPHTDTAPVHNKTFNQLRLEPISLPQATSTPIAKVSVARSSALPMPATTLAQLPIVTNQPINLNALFGDVKPDVGARLPLGSKERKHSSSNEYIDPKLINKCDNLPVSLSGGRALRNNADKTDNAVRRNEACTTTSSTPSSESSTTQTGPISQLTKLLPLAKIEDRQTKPLLPAAVATDIVSKPTCVLPTSAGDAPHPTLSQRNSAEGRNLLKRKMRLGRNQFLYDASPEADDSCSADDEANRSSVEYDKQQQYQQSQSQPHSLSQMQPQLRTQHASLKTPPIIPSIPIFDDFDFEEFLSSFEHDDEQFPLFKDCREFLLNRTSNKQRSTLKPNSIFINTNTNTSNNTHTNTNNNNQNGNQPTKVTNASPNSHTHFQFPSLSAHPTLLLTSSSLRSADAFALPKSTSKESSPQPSGYSNAGTDPYNVEAPLPRTSRHTNHSNHADQKKREIFISIETEQNEHGHSPISPESLRNLVGNPQTMVEVEVDATDNKFSKISDDEPLPPTPNSQRDTRHHQRHHHQHQPSFTGDNHLPNVQLNNAKNLIQKMQDGFRHRSDEMGANMRQRSGSHNHSKKSNTNSLLYCDEGATARAPCDADADSDEMSSLDGYPISAKSSRRGVGSKLSADSAYGSLSRQRSSELSTHRSLSRTRPSTASCSTSTTLPQGTIMQDVATQHRQQLQEATTLPPTSTHYKYPTVKGRARQFSGSSSSDNSDGPLPKIGGSSGGLSSHVNYQQQQQQQHTQQQQQQLYNNNYDGHYELEQQQLQRSNNNTKHRHQSHNSNSNSISSNNNNNNNSSFESPNNSPPASLLNTTMGMPGAAIAAAAANNGNNMYSSSSTSMTGSNPAMSASMKMSKFCHECGSKFIFEQAKFCMDCGVRRIVL